MASTQYLARFSNLNFLPGPADRSNYNDIPNHSYNTCPFSFFHIFIFLPGNALLIGVGGSGKQSLSRLAASISSLEVFQITLRKGYSMADLKLDLAALYIKAGVKNVGTVFLMTDSQVRMDGRLILKGYWIVYINGYMTYCSNGSNQYLFTSINYGLKAISESWGPA